MAINKSTFAVLLIFLSFSNAQCIKNGLDCANTKHSFELPIRAYPDKDSIAIGDTIWFEVNSPTQLQDGITGQLTDYSKTVNLGSGITFRALDAEDKFTISALNRFDFLLLEGIELRSGYSNGLGNEYRFTEKDFSFRFLLGIIAKEKGTYVVLFSRAGNVYRSNDECTKASFDIFFVNTNQHYPLNPFYIPGTTPRGGDYYFVVK